jgi:hypothetical protein
VFVHNSQLVQELLHTADTFKIQNPVSISRYIRLVPGAIILISHTITTTQIHTGATMNMKAGDLNRYRATL